MDSPAWTQTKRNFRDYLLSCGKSQGTANTYVANLSMFWRDCARFEVTPYEADRRLVRAWLSERLQRVSPARAHNELAAVRSFYIWLLETRDREEDPTQGVRVKRTKALPTEPLSRDELSSLLGGCKEERDRLIVLIMAASGLRISELADLRAENIDWPRGVIKVRGKGDKERVIALPAELMDRLHGFVGMFPQGALFLSKLQQRPLSSHQIRKILYDLAARAKLEGVHPHRLRATFATNYMDQFGDIQALQGVMGHESIETTARYAEYTKYKRGLDYMRRLEF